MQQVLNRKGVEYFIELIYDLSGSLFKFVGNFFNRRNKSQTKIR
jgi:hypothetical protein